jgi:putative membrane protein
MWNCATLPWFGGWMAGHSLWGILLAVSIGALLWTSFKSRRSSGSSADRADSQEILKLRLARGEISVEEYNSLKSML